MLVPLEPKSWYGSVFAFSGQKNLQFQNMFDPIESRVVDPDLHVSASFWWTGSAPKCKARSCEELLLHLEGSVASL
jgi:hypothetical protein